MLYEIAIPQWIKMLNNLKGILEKGSHHAEMKGYDFSVLLHSRLAPDQFNLIRQVQIATDMCKLGAARLAGKEAPKHDDTEKTLAELLARIDSVIAYLAAFSKSDFTGAAERQVFHPRWEGKYLSGKEFLLEYSMPNIYFHITTAYAILRHNGVDVGKKDYLGELPLKA